MQMTSLSERIKFQHHSLTDIPFEIGNDVFYEEEFIVQYNRLRPMRLDTSHALLDSYHTQLIQLEKVVETIIPSSATR